MNEAYMSIRILIPTPLRSYAGQQASVEARGRDVAEAMSSLVESHPDLQRHLFDERGTLRNFVNIYLNDDDIRFLKGPETVLRAGDTLTIVPSVAGGAPRVAEDQPELSKEEIRRYSRHLIMPEVTLEGQKRIKAGKVLLVGTGGLGSPAALYLAAAGVGTLGLVDFDVVDESNLQRQILHGTSDVGRSKVLSARESIREANPHVNVVIHETRLTSENALEILSQYDVVADGTDNFPTRYLVNDACVLLGKPNAYGSIFRFDGQASVFGLKDGPCYRCLYPEPPPPGLVPSCAEGGVLGVLPGLIGLVQATEVLKLLMGVGDSLSGRLLLYDALAMTFRTLKVRKDPDCPVCGTHPSIHQLMDYEEFCGALPEGLDFENALTARELHQKLAAGEKLLLLDVREPHEAQISKLPDSRMIPLKELPARASELDSAEDIVVYCHHGMRSASAAQFLREAGFRKVRNLSGGVDAWAEHVDPDMARY
jgi:adenylyltransferase/sulfurtransferase